MLCEKHFVNFLALSDEFLAQELTHGDFWFTEFVEFTGYYFSIPQAMLCVTLIAVDHEIVQLVLLLYGS
jgi:hypothetical protein